MLQIPSKGKRGDYVVKGFNLIDRKSSSTVSGTNAPARRWDRLSYPIPADSPPHRQRRTWRPRSAYPPRLICLDAPPCPPCPHGRQRSGIHRRAHSVSPGGGGGFGSSGSCASSPRPAYYAYGLGDEGRPSRRKSCRCGRGEGWDVGLRPSWSPSLYVRQAIGSDRRCRDRAREARPRWRRRRFRRRFRPTSDSGCVSSETVQSLPNITRSKPNCSDDMGDIGRLLVGGPRCVVRLGYYAGYLAADGRPARVFCDLALPGVPLAVRVVGLSDVVEHEERPPDSASPAPGRRASRYV